MASGLTTPVPAPLIDKSGPIRRLTDANIQASIDAALSKLDPNDHGAFVAYADQSGNVKGAVMARLGEHWSVVVAGEKRPGEAIEGQAEVRFRW